MHRKPGFVARMLAKHQYTPDLDAAAIVAEFHAYFRELERKARARGMKTRGTYLGSVQYALSRFKTTMKAPADFKKHLHLSREDTLKLAKEKEARLRNHSIDLVAIQGDTTVLHCRELLTHPDFSLKVIAVACLTGRRMAEIVTTIKLEPPRERHFTNAAYWACASGFVKQRGLDACLDIPLFATRNEINMCIKALRAQCGPVALSEVNALVGKKIARAMHKYCPEIGNIHAFRKFYVLMCNHYFNERHCSLPRLGADYLGHRNMSETMLTYLNFRITGVGQLNFS
jgi:hypothetical protein